jgi:regulator of protease activity HflC (stomatin/prohibitin superfamily)
MWENRKFFHIVNYVVRSQTLTNDGVTVYVDGVVDYRICRPSLAGIFVEDAFATTRRLASAALSAVFRDKKLSEVICDGRLNESFQVQICSIIFLKLVFVSSLPANV